MTSPNTLTTSLKMQAVQQMQAVAGRPTASLAARGRVAAAAPLAARRRAAPGRAARQVTTRAGTVEKVSKVELEKIMEVRHPPD